MGKRDSHYHIIKEAAGKHGLPDAFRLSGAGEPDGADELKQRCLRVPARASNIDPLIAALSLERENGYKAMALAAEAFFGDARAVRGECDALRAWLLSHAEGVPSAELCGLTARRLLKKSSCVGAIKAALVMMAVAEPRDPGEMKKLACVLALSGEYTESVAAAAAGWPDYVDVLIELAQKADCVGRVAIANRLCVCAPRREARDFMFFRACLDNPMAAYCAGACAEGGGLRERLNVDEVPGKAFKAASAIVAALFDLSVPEAYSENAERLRDLDELTLAYLRHAASRPALSMQACRALYRVYRYYDAFVRDVTGWGGGVGSDAERCLEAAALLVRGEGFLDTVRGAAREGDRADMRDALFILRDMRAVGEAEIAAVFTALLRDPLGECDLMEYLPDDDAYVQSLADLYGGVIRTVGERERRALRYALPALVRRIDLAKPLLLLALDDPQTRLCALRALHARLSGSHLPLQTTVPELYRTLFDRLLTPDYDVDLAGYLARDAMAAADEGVCALMVLPGMDEPLGFDEGMLDRIGTVLRLLTAKPDARLSVEFLKPRGEVESVTVACAAGAFCAAVYLSGEPERAFSRVMADEAETAALLRGLMCGGLSMTFDEWQPIRAETENNGQPEPRGGEAGSDARGIGRRRTQ